MPATTTRHRIPYPVGGDRVSTLDDTGKAQAERIDTIISTLIAAPANQKVHQEVPPNATPVLKAVFYSGTTNQYGQLVIPVTGPDLTGWHSAVCTHTNLSGAQHDVTTVITGTHQSGPIVTFTDPHGTRVARQGIGITVFVVGWKA